MAREKKGKKKRGCLGRIIRWAIILTVVVVGAAIFLDEDFFDFGDDYDYISAQEIAAGNEDLEYGSLLDLFFNYYGYLPDENDDYNYDSFYDNYDYDNYNSSYDYDDYNDYYSNFDKNNNYYDYYNDYYNDNYDNYDYGCDYDDYDDYNYNKPSNSGSKPTAPASTDNYSGYTAQTVASNSLSKFVECAKKYLGTPYVWGGTSKNGIDCSGLVYLAAQDAGLGTLPRTAKTLYAITSKIDKKDLEAGDLVFFQANNSISHVAIFIGNNQILHAVSEGSNTGVITSKLSQDYWKKHYYASGRIMSDSVASKRATTRAQTRSRSMNFDYD